MYTVYTIGHVCSLLPPTMYVNVYACRELTSLYTIMYNGIPSWSQTLCQEEVKTRI